MKAKAMNYCIIRADMKCCTLSIWAVFLLLLGAYNHQRPRCDSAWLHATNHLIHVFPR